MLVIQNILEQGSDKAFQDLSEPFSEPYGASQATAAGVWTGVCSNMCLPCPARN